MQELTETEWDTLLHSLDGTILYRDDGYWWKLHFWRTEQSLECPHGLRYELTLHDRYNHRIYGYDNAHGVDIKKKFSGRRVEHDHLHKTKSDKGVPYDFESADKLIEDFFNGIDAAIERHKTSKHH